MTLSMEIKNTKKDRIMTIRKNRFLLIFSVFFHFLFLTILAFSSEVNVNTKIYKDFSPLYGKELDEARKARDAADIMLQKYRDLYRISPRDYPGKRPSELANMPLSQQQIKDYQEVISAFKEIVNKYEGTEVAAYCQLRLTVPYQCLRQHQEAILQAQIAAKKFAGTSYEAKAYSRIGDIYLQNLKDLNKAIEWYNKIPQPKIKKIEGRSPQAVEYREAEMQYTSAQLKIADCKIRLGKAQEAIQIFDNLSQQYPEQKNTFEHDKKMQLDIDLRQRFGIDKEKQLNSIIENPELLQESVPVISIEPNISMNQPLPKEENIQNKIVKSDVIEQNPTPYDVLAQPAVAPQSRYKTIAVSIISIISLIVIIKAIFHFYKKYKSII